MAFIAHDGALFVFHMAALALKMVSICQIQQTAPLLTDMTCGTLLVLGGLVFNELSVIIHMVAFIAIFNASLFIMILMEENSFWPHAFAKSAVVHRLNIFLRKGAYSRECHNGQYHSQLNPNYPVTHWISPRFSQITSRACACDNILRVTTSVTCDYDFKLDKL
jgi:hypothetical protein